MKQHRHITLFDICVFLRQFATLMAAGIPIIQSCEILEKSQEKIALRLLIYSIKREILSGKNLFYSMQQCPRYFNALTCQLVRIGEQTGKLDTMLIMIANHQEKNMAFKKRVQQALFYPCIIMITALIVTLGMFLFVIPHFATLFHDMEEKLPLLTLWIFYLSAKLKQYLWLGGVLTFLFILAIYHGQHQPHVKRYLQQLTAKLPLIKECLRKILLARFARQLAIAFAAGIPITEALTLAGNAHDNSEFTQTIVQLRNHINAGLPLHHAMEGLAYFPAFMTQMIKIGEESGMLEPMLSKTADFFESDIDQLVSRFHQLLEPLIMIVLGVLIGGLIIGMYLPIFKLGNIL
jgi:type IV pilus assembly protein PilC